MLVTRRNFEDAISSLRGQVVYGIDTETTGLKQSDSLFSIIISTPIDIFYFNFKEYPDEGIMGDHVLGPEHKKVLSEVLHP